MSSTWTEPEFRGKGLASRALAHVVQTMAAPGRRFWYLSRESNIASIRVCRHAGFEFSCYGAREPAFGLRALGKVRRVLEPPNVGTEERTSREIATATEAWYARYYSKMGADRNDLRVNRGVLFQTMASERSLISAFYQVPLDLSIARVLDVGCGSGAGWYQLFRLGVDPRKTVGIDIQAERLAPVVRLYPQSIAILADAASMPFGDASFDLVHESTMFAVLPDEHIRVSIAAEMVRVCRPRGYLLLVDWRTPKLWDRDYRALTRTDVQKLFGVGQTTSLIGAFRGSLIPPLGRLLSTYAPGLYFLASGLCPPLVGQVVYLLRKH